MVRPPPTNLNHGEMRSLLQSRVYQGLGLNAFQLYMSDIPCVYCDPENKV